MPIFGYNDIVSSGFYIFDKIAGTLFTLPEEGVPQTIYARIYGVGAGIKVRCAIYDTNGNFIVATDEKTVIAEDQYTPFSISGTKPTLLAGDYYLFPWGASTAGVGCRSQWIGANKIVQVESPPAYGSPFPATVIISPTLVADQHVAAIYCEYSLIGGLAVAVTPASSSVQVGQTQILTAIVTGGTMPYSVAWLDSFGNPLGMGETLPFTPTVAGITQIYAIVTDAVSTQAQSNSVTVTATTAPPSGNTWDSCDVVGQWRAIQTESVPNTVTPVPLTLNNVDKVEGISSIECVVPSGIYNCYLIKNDGGSVVGIYDFSVNNTLTFRVKQKGRVVPIIFSITTRYPDLSHYDGHGYGDVGSGMVLDTWQTFTVDLRLPPDGSVVGPDDLSKTAQLAFEIQANTGGADVLIDFFTTSQGAPISLIANTRPEVSQIKLSENVVITCNAYEGTGVYGYRWYVDGNDTGNTSSAFTYVGTIAGIHEIYCVVTDGVSTVTTNISTVTVIEPLPPPVPARPLHIDGRYIKDDLGNIYRFHGVNTAGFLDYPNGVFFDANGVMHWGGNVATFAEQLPYVQQEIDGIRQWKFNSVRIMFGIDEWTGNLSDFRANIKTYIDMCAANGITVLLCPASIRYGVNAKIGGIPLYDYMTIEERTAVGWTSNADFATWWAEVANYLKTCTNVIFDLWNEPGASPGVDETTYRNAVQDTITAIRATGATQIIIYNIGYGPSLEMTGGGGQTLEWISRANFTDPANNILFSTHYYRSSGCFGFWWTGSWATRQCAYLKTDMDTTFTYEKLLSIAQQYPLVVAEIGADNSGATATRDGYDPQLAEKEANQYFFEVLNQAEVGWLAFWFRAGSTLDLVVEGQQGFIPTATNGLLVQEAINNLVLDKTLSLQVSPSDVGTISLNPIPPYAQDTLVSLTAIVTNPNFAFVKWTDGLGADYTGFNGEPETSPNTSIMMDADKSIIAVFQEITHPTLTLIVTPTASGSLAVGEPPPYNVNQVVNVTATPSSGYILSGWLKDGIPFDGTDSQISLTLDVSHTLTAIFTTPIQAGFPFWTLIPAGVIGAWYLLKGKKHKRK